jgi:hypothetical protein
LSNQRRGEERRKVEGERGLRVIGTNPKTTKEPKPPFLIKEADLELEEPNIAMRIPMTRMRVEVQR